jgi:hypothetical protein
MSNKAPFPVDPALTAIAIAYRNSRLIADEVLPRIPPLPRQEFQWWKFALDENFRIPDTKVGRTSRPNEVEFSASQESESTEDYALDDPIPQSDIDNASEGYDPVGRATESLTDLIMLDREKRCADIVFDENTYPPTQRETLSGADQFSDSSSKPIVKLMRVMDKMIMRPNIMVIGRLAFTDMIQNPSIVRAYHRNDGGDGTADAKFLADILGLEQILVGEAWLVTSKKGQATTTTARVWGKHIALLHRDKLANPTTGSAGRATFGFTAQWGQKVAGKIPDPHIGMRGGMRIRSGESVKECICAPDFGYFLKNVVA